MDKAYDHKKVEESIYKSWEENGYFKPEVNPEGEPYTIILPPPNANGALHFGHAMFTVEDILIRYHRMRGYAALWVPGADHAGIETQFVFEKKLASEGKSRFDFSREQLYNMIDSYVKENRGGIESQLRKLGFSLDWSREKYTLDPDIVKLVCNTFKKMYHDGLIYRGARLVNYCTRDGTSFSDLEVNHKEQKDPMYYIKYGPFTIATVRPETKFGDTAVAVNPDDTRYKKYIGQEIEIETLLGKKKMKVIADSAIDPNFGTGAMKVTPAHDAKDFDIGQRHNLPPIQVIGLDGKLNEKTGKYQGSYVKQARKIVAQDMQKMGLIEKVDENYTHTIEVCYKCGTTIEPMLLPQWFIKVESLKTAAIESVKKGKIKIYPKNFEAPYFQWLENLRDWNISRQIVWGIRIPAWRCKNCSETNNQELITNNQNGWIVTAGEKPEKCPNCNSTNLEQDPDTFDTWFSSGQWPFVTLKTGQPGDFEKFYPTNVMETAYDILKAWVTRMVMLGVYSTGEVPFKDVLFHGLVNDPYGKKMSKSRGNVVNPLELVDQYGADAVRFALVYGNATGNDQVLSYPKLDAARKFTNKLWNMARFIQMQKESVKGEGGSLNKNNLTMRHHATGNDPSAFGEMVSPFVGKQFNNLVIHDSDKEWVKKTEKLVKEITKYIDAYQFNLAAERLYDFAWHEFADLYIEDVKNRIDENSYFILNTLYLILLKLLHPFMPFVTEELYKTLGFGNEKKMLIIEQWPK